MSNKKKNQTSFKTGNKYYKLRKKHGRFKLFTPDELWKLACEYFEWIDENPFTNSDTKVKSGGKNGEELEIKTSNGIKPYTESGLASYIGITESTWFNYCSGKEPYADFLEVTSMIKQIIKTQKFEGAAAGLFNANIIARDLGLTDKQEVKTNLNINGGSKLTFDEIINGGKRKK